MKSGHATDDMVDYTGSLNKCGEEHMGRTATAHHHRQRGVDCSATGEMVHTGTHEGDRGL